MQLKSNAFKNGSGIPKRFTCDGENISPALSWTGAPPDAKSFVIVCCDPDAPAGTWYHWGIYDLSPTRHELEEGPPDSDAAAREAINDFGDRGYGGPS